MAVKISGMMGTGSMGHNNRKFITENVDPARTEQNITLCRENLKQVYHELFDEALAEYNAKKTKTRDKIPDYYRHIEKSKQERLFHEVIFQIGNKDNCGCETPEGERAAAALKEFAEAFQERNPHLRVFNSVIHMDEATPHIHIDFVPVATVTTLPLALAVHPSVKARNVQELVAWARSQQKTLDVGIPAPASQPQFGVSLLAKRFGIQASPVPYRGGAPMVADLMGGHVLAGLTGISEFLPLHKSGAVRMIAVSGPERLARFPDVPTFTEGGLPGFEERTFMGVFAPAGTPSETVARYREAIRKVVASTEYQQALDELGLQAQFGDGADLAARVKHTNQTWGPVIRESGFVAQ